MECGDAIRQYWTPERMRSAKVEKNECIERNPGKKQFQAANQVEPTIVLDATRIKPPYNAVGALFYVKADTGFHATAYVVDTGKGDNVLFTAAHNLENANGKAERIHFVPARQSDGSTPYGSFQQMPASEGKGKAWFVPEKWGKDGERPVEYDFGAITLSKNKEGMDVGKVVTPLKYKVDLEYSKEFTKWRIIGFPEENKMCESDGDFIEVHKDLVYRTNPTLDGMSGSPWMLPDPDKSSKFAANGALRGGFNESTCAYFRQSLIDAVVNQIK